MLFIILTFFFINPFAENTFPCENVKDYDSCDRIGWCMWDNSSCVKDVCMKSADENTDCGSGCLKNYLNSDTDCETGEHVNFTNFYCANISHNFVINSCFYESLKNGSCSPKSGCQNYSLSGSDYCSDAEDNCYMFGTNYCHIAPWCLFSNGQCVHDPCTDEFYLGPGHVCENPECAPHNFYGYYDNEVGYMVATFCVNKKNTNPNVCARLAPYTMERKGNFCSDLVYTPSICTDVSFCRVFDVASDFFPSQHVCDVVPSNESNESNEDDGKAAQTNKTSKSWMIIGIVFIALTAVLAVALVIVVVVLLRKREYSSI